MNIRIELLIEQGETKLKREYLIPSEEDLPKKDKQADVVTSDKRYVDIKLLSTYLKVKVPTLRDWIRDKKIPFHRLGSLIRFDLQQIDEWITEKNQKGGHDHEK